MSKSSLMLIVILTTIITLVSSQSAQPALKPIFGSSSRCSYDSGNYSSGSPYDTNVKTTLTTLQHQSNSTNFNNTTSGTEPDTVYGQYYCRGDISRHVCSLCVQAASIDALQQCNVYPTLGRAANATVYKPECTVRYSNTLTYGVLETGLPFSASSGIVSDPQRLSSLLRNTVNGLIEEAVNNTSLFATGNETDVYSLVQCSPDLNRKQCETCLRSLYNDEVSNVDVPPATLYAMYPNCQIMYSAPAVEPPLISSPAPAPEIMPSSEQPTATSSSVMSTPSVSQQPQPQPPNNGGSDGVGRSESKKTRIVTAAIMILLIFI